jgi:hypothetical protein
MKTNGKKNLKKRNHMKKIAIYFLTSFTCLVGLTSCDEGFDEMNRNPVQATSLDPAYVLNRSIISTPAGGGGLIYEMGIVQQIVSPNGGVLTGANFNQENREAAGNNWRNFYRTVIKHTTDVIQATAGDQNRVNIHNMARIWQAYSAMILTDTYGDVPYSEAGLGFLEGQVNPTYDTQQAIYQDILRELEQASAALNASARIEPNDVLYNGNVTRWKRLGYSLMLRAAMRHSKVAPNVAQEYVTKAVAGGLMQSNDDNAVVRFSQDYANFTNGIGGTLNGGERNNFYLTGTFVSHLKQNNDPRLASIAVRYVGAANGGQQVAARANRSPEVQLGMPMGYDNATIVPVAAQAGLASFYEFSQLDRERMGSQFAPAFLVTYAQTQLLLAEAVVRGWAQGNAANLFAGGIRAHMQQLALYGDNSAVPGSAIDAYLQANPLNPTSANALQQINTEYWLASFLDPYEAFANFRRSGFPTIPPNPFPGRDINTDFIRRLSYPDTEYAVNQGNVQQAVARQGADRLDTRVWWDKP